MPTQRAIGTCSRCGERMPMHELKAHLEEAHFSALVEELEQGGRR